MTLLAPRIPPSGPFAGSPGTAIPYNNAGTMGRVWRNQGLNASGQVALTTAYQTILEVDTADIPASKFAYDIEFHTTVLTQTGTPSQVLELQAWNSNTSAWVAVDNTIHTVEKGDHVASASVKYVPTIAISKFRLAAKMTTTATTDACTLAADNKTVGRVFEYLSV